MRFSRGTTGSSRPQFFYYASLGAWGAATTVPCGEVSLEGSLELACPAEPVMKAYEPTMVLP